MARGQARHRLCAAGQVSAARRPGAGAARSTWAAAPAATSTAWRATPGPVGLDSSAEALDFCRRRGHQPPGAGRLPALRRQLLRHRDRARRDRAPRRRPGHAARTLPRDAPRRPADHQRAGLPGALELLGPDPGPPPPLHHGTHAPGGAPRGLARAQGQLQQHGDPAADGRHAPGQERCATARASVAMPPATVPRQMGPAGRRPTLCPCPAGSTGS